MTQGYNNLINILNNMPDQLRLGSPEQQAKSIANQITKGASKPLITRAGLATAAKMAPLTGDIWDIYRGTTHAASGHPFIGTGQALMGLGGLATLGGGSLVKGGLKNLAKNAVEKNIIEKNLAKQAYVNTARNINNASDLIHAKPLAKSIVPEVAYGASDILPSLNGLIKNTNISSGNINTPNGLEVIDDSTLGLGNGNVIQPVSIGNVNQQKQAKDIIEQITGQQKQQPVTQQQADAQAINDYISQLQQIQQPYVNALQNYLNNYNKMLYNTQMESRRLRDVSAITGDPILYKSATDYNQLNNEANRVSAVKQLQDTQASDLNAINEAMGNLAIADELGLQPQAAFANKNLLTALSMRERDEVKKAIADANVMAKLYGIDIKTALALRLQGMKGQNAIDVANIYAGLSGGVAPGLNAQGIVPVMVNQQTQQQVDPRQKFFK